MDLRRVYYVIIVGGVRRAPSTAAINSLSFQQVGKY